MKGIDIYHGESKNGTVLKPIPEKAYKESDFVIVKSTQGVSYKYTSFFHSMIKRVLKDQKLAGAYHYAAGNDPVKEADYFISVIKPYIGKIVLCLDWEGMQNKAFGSKTWCTKFINRVKEKTGVTCILYTGTDGCKQNESLVGKVPLWYAGYPKPQSLSWSVPKWKYNLGKWGEPAIWQYTSSNEKVDRNTTSWTKTDWNKYVKPTPSTDVMLNLLSEYHVYIKEHYKYFKYEYTPSMTTFSKAKSVVAKKKTVGITCLTPFCWALAEMGINPSWVYATDGTFKSHYSGDIKTLFQRITSGGPIGMTVKQAVDKKLLKAGDVCTFKDLTHTFVYSGKGYVVYEGGNVNVVNGHYPNGIKPDYSKHYGTYKISEILRMKVKEKKKATPKTGGDTITFPAVRKYYQYGDGYKTLVNYRDQIELIQKALNRTLKGVKGFKAVEVDGKYGKATEAAVKLYQKRYKLTIDGKWGKQCNAKEVELR